MGYDDDLERAMHRDLDARSTPETEDEEPPPEPAIYWVEVFDNVHDTWRPLGPSWSTEDEAYSVKQLAAARCFYSSRALLRVNNTALFAQEERDRLDEADAKAAQPL